MPNDDDPAARAFQSAPDPLFTDLAAQARSKDSAQRRTALKALGQMGTAGIEPLLALLRDTMRTRRRVRKTFSFLAWLLLPVSVLMIPSLLFSLCVNSVGRMLLVALLVWTANWLLFVLRSRLPLTRRQKDIAETFTSLNDLRAIGPLLEALSSNSEQDPPMLRATLARLLTQLQATHTSLLDRRHRALLYRELSADIRSTPQAEFKIAILRALEQVGDAEALPYVGQLARQIFPRQAHQEGAAAAWRCMEFLTAKGGDQMIRNTLLRGSERSDARPDTLLRPAENAIPTHIEQLLRPDMPPADPLAEMDGLERLDKRSGHENPDPDNPGEAL